MKKRPVTTLFMLSSVDGKISTGASDTLDVDSDYDTVWRNIKWNVPEGKTF